MSACRLQCCMCMDSLRNSISCYDIVMWDGFDWIIPHWTTMWLSFSIAWHYQHYQSIKSLIVFILFFIHLMLFDVRNAFLDAVFILTMFIVCVVVLAILVKMLSFTRFNFNFVICFSVSQETHYVCTYTYTQITCVCDNYMSWMLYVLFFLLSNVNTQQRRLQTGVIQLEKKTYIGFATMKMV